MQRELVFLYLALANTCKFTLREKRTHYIHDTRYSDQLLIIVEVPYSAT